jgi:hypothetical protein
MQIDSTSEISSKQARMFVFMEICQLQTKGKIGNYEICDDCLMMHLPESSEDQPSRINHQGRQPLITERNTMFKSCSGIQIRLLHMQSSLQSWDPINPLLFEV